MATNNRTTTSANGILLLSVQGLFPNPIRIQGFGPDDMIATDSIENIERSMGADGRLSAGFTPVIVPMTITLQADSMSIDFFEQVMSAQEAAQEAYIFDGTYVLPSNGKKYQLTRGVLASWPRFPSARRVLQPRAARIDWERVSPALS